MNEKSADTSKNSSPKHNCRGGSTAVNGLSSKTRTAGGLRNPTTTLCNGNVCYLLSANLRKPTQPGNKSAGSTPRFLVLNTLCQWLEFRHVGILLQMIAVLFMLWLTLRLAQLGIG